MKWAQDIGVDLGTASVLVYLEGKGIILREPSVVAIDKATGEVLAVGENARRMIGRTSGNIVALRPLRQGVIADYETTERMLSYFLARSVGRRFFKPRVLVCVPSGVTAVEKRAVAQAAVQAGARQTFMIEEPLAAALGAGLDLSEPYGHLVIDIGGGTTDIAILSLGGIVLSKSLRVGGDRFDEAIIRYVRDRYNILIGERSAEELKIQVGSAVTEGRTGNPVVEVRGRHLVDGLPKTIVVSSAETFETIREVVDQVVEAVKEILEQISPELAADIVESGIILTGGGSLLHGLGAVLEKETGLGVRLADDPVSCVAKGTGKALNILDQLKRSGALISGGF